MLHHIKQFILIVTLVMPSVYAQVLPLNTFEEYQIKANYLFHIIHYTRWPDSVTPKNENPLLICVLGQDPFGSILHDIAKRKEFLYPVVIRYKDKIDEISACHLVFISQSESARISDIFKQLESVPVLTVSDINGFSEQGGIIGFVIQSNKVKMHINVSSSRRTGIQLNAFLMEVATRLYN